MDVLTMVRMLQRSCMEPLASRRGERDPWVIGGGPAVTLNPETHAPFLDLAMIGESEEILPLILSAWGEAQERGLSREETKQYLARFPGVYVPAFSYPHYQDHRFLGLQTHPLAPQRIERQWIDLDRHETRTFLYTPFSHFVHAALVEITRGCGFCCRFCAGTSLYSPLRHRSFSLVTRMLDAICSMSLHIGVVGADVLSHPEWPAIMEILQSHSATVSFSSLSGVTLARKPEILSFLPSLGTRSITLAPETGVERTRRMLGKGMGNEEWREVIRLAFGYGIRKIKLYFILGKPESPAEEDLDFLNTCTHDPGIRDALSISYSFLVPKPQTPFERLEALPFSVWKREKKVFETGMKKLGLSFTGESLRMAWLELILARGDRLLAEQIPDLMNTGNEFSWDGWRRVLERIGRDFLEWPRSPWGGGPQPWDVVEMGGKKCGTGKLGNRGID
ncbi:MAG: radical SAM protein [Candidatus Atribacteria bacterium]|nr:radical SAM protein [Candidatus Atribacteria bacterium]